MSIKDTISLIDETIELIKSKDDDKSYFGKDNLNKFELKLFLLLYLVRFELQKINKLTDLTASAVSQLFAFTVFEYYRQDFPEVYTKCAQLHSNLGDYNLKLKNHDLTDDVNFEKESWVDFFTNRISSLL